MSTCEFESRLNAFHDDELSPAERQVVADHLAGCADCQASLVAIEEMSAMFATAEPVPLSQMGRARLHWAVDRQAERGLMRMSWALSAVAAAIMVVGSVWLKTAEPTSPPTLYTTPIVYTADANTPAEQYYLADATVRATEDW